MKRVREIILDFTPLLDVTLIILFYFILFSHLGAAEAQQKADAAMNEAAEAQATAEQMMTEAEEKTKQADAKYQALVDAENNAAEIGEALAKFESSENLCFQLEAKDGWQQLLVKKGNTIIGEPIKVSGSKEGEVNPSLKYELVEILRNAQVDETNNLLCIFIYDSSKAGTKRAYDEFYDVWDKIKAQYQNFHLYLSFINLDNKE